MTRLGEDQQELKLGPKLNLSFPELNIIALKGDQL